MNAYDEALTTVTEKIDEATTILDAYNTAVKEKYRFFSFGDCMFIN